MSVWTGVINCYLVNPLTDDKILGLPKLKAFADDKSNVTQNIKVVFHRIENIVEKEENAGYQHFLLFPQCFQKAFSSSVSKVIVWWWFNGKQLSQNVFQAVQQKSVADEEGMVGVVEGDGKEIDSDDDEDDDENDGSKDGKNDDKEDSDDNEEEGDDVDAKTKVDDEDEEDSGVEEEEGIEVSDDIKKKIKEALGDAAVDSDNSSEV